MGDCFLSSTFLYVIFVALQYKLNKVILNVKHVFFGGSCTLLL